MTIQPWKACTCIIAPIAFILSLSTGVSAQSINQKFRLELETRVFRFQNITTKQEGSSSTRSGNVIEFGVFSSNSSFSRLNLVPVVPASTLGADLAFGLSEHMLLGSRLLFDCSHIEDDDWSIIEFALSPHVDYVFLAARKIRPFLGLQLGFQLASQVGGGNDKPNTVYMLGAEFGLLGFIVDALSIDPRLSFLYSIGEHDHYKANSFSMVFLVGLSGWM